MDLSHKPLLAQPPLSSRQIYPSGYKTCYHLPPRLSHTTAHLPAYPVCSHFRESIPKLPHLPPWPPPCSSPIVSSLVPLILTGPAPHATTGTLGTPNLDHVPYLLHTLPWCHLTHSRFQGPCRWPLRPSTISPRSLSNLMCSHCSSHTGLLSADQARSRLRSLCNCYSLCLECSSSRYHIVLATI